ncbi:hypothetical protein FEF33_13895 (plasmid) [Moraxella osloensis]|nr:hypothetical protein FEF33_13895 [Moraxella osloensis]
MKKLLISLGIVASTLTTFTQADASMVLAGMVVKGGSLKPLPIKVDVCKQKGVGVDYCSSNNIALIRAGANHKPANFDHNKYVPVVFTPYEVKTGALPSDAKAFVLFDPVKQKAFTLPWLLREPQQKGTNQRIPISFQFKDIQGAPSDVFAVVADLIADKNNTFIYKNALEVNYLISFDGKKYYLGGDF